MGRRRTKSDSERGERATAATKRGSRPLPKWLTGQSEMDDVARRRCLMILSVLSGERAVSDVIEEQGISRGTYYNFEQRALEAMLSSLVPNVSAETSATQSASPQQRIAALEAKVQRLERDKRRTERLLFLTRRVIGRGKVTSAAGRPKKKATARSSTKIGPTASPSSTTRVKADAKKKVSAAQPSPASGGSISTPSIPSAAGVDVR